MPRATTNPRVLVSSETCAICFGFPTKKNLQKNFQLPKLPKTKLLSPRIKLQDVLIWLKFRSALHLVRVLRVSQIFLGVWSLEVLEGHGMQDKVRSKGVGCFSVSQKSVAPGRHPALDLQQHRVLARSCRSDSNKHTNKILLIDAYCMLWPLTVNTAML